jgi:hypothetical protein
LVIVEGCDGSGKTTLVKHICKQWGFSQGERGTKDRDKLYEVTRKDTHKALALAVEATREPKVWDRLFYSDFVYAPIQRRPIAFQEPEASIIQAVIEAIAPPLIVCCPPLPVCEANAAKEHQMEGVNKNLRRIWERYIQMFAHEEFALMGRTGALWYDYTGECTPPKMQPDENPLPWTSKLESSGGLRGRVPRAQRGVHSMIETASERWMDYHRRRDAWVGHNFPPKGAEIPGVFTTMGIIEECGELAHAHLKEAQAIRGTGEKHQADARDAVGDLTVYLWGITARQPASFVDTAFWNKVRRTADLPFTADQRILKIALRVGYVAGIISKDLPSDLLFHQTARLVGHLIGYCEARGWDYHRIVDETWEAVEKRDWIKYPENGFPPTPAQEPVDEFIP